MVIANFASKVEERSSQESVFVFSPLTKSFGHSMGNALRRTLLSSLPGAVASYVKFAGVDHMFSTIKGVKESVLEIILNIKKMRFAVDSDKEVTIRLNAKGKGIVSAKDFKGEVKAVNEDLYIAEIADDQTELEIEVVVISGVGYVLAEEKEKRNGYMAVDSFFSPVNRVNYQVNDVRVGEKLDHEELVMQVITDGSISPKDAVKKSADILNEHFGHVMSKVSSFGTGDGNDLSNGKSGKTEEKGSDIIIDELALPSRVINALLKENIETVADLVKRGRSSLAKLKGVGKKSVELIEEELKRMDIELS